MPALATKIPFKTLLSFGDMVFSSGGGTLPDGVATDTSPVSAEPTVVRPRIAHPVLSYGYNQYGYSPGPMVDYSSTWIVTIVAALDLGDVDACYQALEACYATWYGLWRGTHTHRTITGTTGQLGDLLVADAHDAAWLVEAELLAMPLKLVPGDNVLSFQVQLDFKITEDWVVAP